MISAKLAREKTVQSKEKAKLQKMNAVSDAIDKAVAEEKTSVFVAFKDVSPYQTALVEKLQRLKYKITTEAAGFKISWASELTEDTDTK